MVLSNKKLKAKFRSLLAESFAALESKSPSKDLTSDGINEQLERVKELLGSRKKPRPSSRRGKRRKKPKDSKPVEESGEDQKENQGNDESIGLKEEEEKRKSGKRKRDGEGADEETEKKQQQPKKKKQKKQKKDKKKDKGKGKKEDKQEDKGQEKGNESMSGENGRRVQESIDIEQSEESAKKVYAGGIPYYSTEDDIRSFFEGCGTVTEVDCMSFPESGKFRGIAILSFKTDSAAKRALALDGADMGGFYLKVQPYRANRTQKSNFAPEMVEGYNRIYVGNLSWDITEEDLRKLFSDCKVSSIRWGTDKETGDFRGYAHVDFVDSVSLTIALKLDQEVICGRPVRIRCAVPKREVETKSSSKPFGKKAEAEAEASTNEGGSKKKRRTCYECGVPGHLASSCPKKIAVEVNDGSGAGN